MSFHVYPDEAGNAQDHPLTIAAAASSGLKPIGAFPASGTRYIRIAMQGAGANPTISLKADAGAETPVPVDDGMFHAVDNGTTDAGDARLESQANGVFKLTVFLNAASSWQIGIKNNAAAALGFTWVVADSDAESQQPWIDLAPAAAFKTYSGAADPQGVVVNNRGTGPLTLTAGAAPAANFSAPTVPAAIPPGGSGTMTFTYTGAASPGQVTASYTALQATTGDSTAAPGASAHNNKVTFTATTRQIEAVFLVDASGSMAYRPDGNPAPVADQARWAKLKVGATQSMNLLPGFAADKGKFALVEFPDITTGVVPAPSPSSKLLQAATDISTANVKSALDTLDVHTPVPNGGATPMGHGMATAMGSTATTFGQFQGTANPNAVNFNERFLILQTDGANNSGPPNPGDFYPPGGPTNQFTDKKIKVIAVGYGKPGTAFEVDDALLKALKDQSSGYFLDANADDSGLALRKQLQTAIVEALDLDPTVDPVGYLSTAAPELRREVAVLPFDNKVGFVVDWATRDAPIQVSLVTPLCEVITETSAAADPRIYFRTDSFHRMFVFDAPFLRNDAQPARPRYGNWTLIITHTRPQQLVGPGEQYQYAVITESRLKMEVSFDRARYAPGDRISISAALRLDGVPIPNASVTLQLGAPGQSKDNWIARSPVSAAALGKAREILRGEDVTAVGIKSFALQLEKATFNDFHNTRSIAMLDAGQIGVYSASFDATSVPGTYDFYVTAVGVAPGNVAFRREGRATTRVEVTARKDFTLIGAVYKANAASALVHADVRIFPLDQFGNVILFDPAIRARISLQAKGAELSGPMVFNGDGSYSVGVDFRANANPVLAVAIDGAQVIPEFPLAPIGQLTWVDKVVDFRPGREGKEGANGHRRPEDVLGDPSAKKPGVFLSLGGSGSVTVAVAGHSVLAQGRDDVIVFVEPDETLRPYSVEVQGPNREWVSIGTSAGVTQSFTLGSLPATAAIRITDRSARIRTDNHEPLSTPGVSVVGVGVRKTK